MDWIINDELGLTVGDVFGLTAASAMVIGGIIPYIPQYRQIKRTQDAEGFSLHVCLALLVANSLRILFWFKKRYELPLLIQSIVMNITMFLMIHLCVKVKRLGAIMISRDRVFAGEDDGVHNIDDGNIGNRGSIIGGGGGSRGGGGGSSRSINGSINDGSGISGSNGQITGGISLGGLIGTANGCNSRSISVGDVSRSGGGSIKSREERAGITLDDHHNLPVVTSIGGGDDDGGGGGRDGDGSSQIKRRQSKHYLSDFDLRYFWAWTDFQSYLDFMLVFWIIGAGITYIMLSIEWFMELVGFLAVFTEAMLGAPQFLRNFANKSTHGMSLHMVVMWTCGDIFKTAYFVVRHAPTQFWICGSLQVTLDFAILLQVYIYRRNSIPRNTHRGD